MIYDLLKSRNEAFKNVSDEIERRDLPAGEYRGEIYDAKIIQSEKNKKWYVRIAIKVIGEQYNGFIHTKLYSLEEPAPGKFDRLVFLKRDLGILESGIAELTDLEMGLENILNKKVKFKVLMNKNGFLATEFVGLTELGLDDSEVVF